MLFQECNNNVIDKPDKNPNIILIVTDDQGIGDIGYTGNPYIKTPVLDSLASSAYILENFYVSPVCAPTRSSLLTGRYSVRTGIHDTYNGGATMASEEITIAEILGNNGYKTAMFGKWHLGDNYPFRPSDQGFQESLYHPSGGIGQVGDINNYYKFDSSYFNSVLYHNNELLESNGYCSDVFTDFAIKFIEKKRNFPFFLYLSFNAPHTPLQLPGEYYEMYRNLTDELIEEEDSIFFGKVLDENDIDAARRVYGMVSNIDDNIKRILKKLEETEINDNTIIIFLTDNGPQQNRYRAGYRGRKGSVYEGGIKVPAFIVLPGSGSESITQTLAHIDILPTVLGLADIKYEAVNKIDGSSFMPVLEGYKASIFETRTLISNWQRGYPEPYRNISVHKGDYKLVGHISSYDRVDKLELFNIRTDPVERNNISASEPGKLTELKEEFDKWYMDIIHNNKLKAQYAIIGSDMSEEIILNRNDACGEPGIWAQDEVFGYWHIECIQPAEYKISINFKENIITRGKLVLKIAPLQRTVDINDPGSSEIIIENLYIPEGKYMVESWFQSADDRRIFPFYIKITESVK